MAGPRKHREALLDSAVTLFRKQGYAGTGLNQILADSGAPKGSLYHYFPDGKIGIGAEAVRRAGSRVAATLRDLAARDADPARLLTTYFGMVAAWIEESDFHDGSPIAATLLETAADNPGIREAGADAFHGWSVVLEEVMVAGGIDSARSRRLAMLAIAALEGAIVQSHVFRSRRPLTDAAAEIAALLDAARASGGQGG